MTARRRHNCLDEIRLSTASGSREINRRFRSRRKLSLNAGVTFRARSAAPAFSVTTGNLPSPARRRNAACFSSISARSRAMRSRTASPRTGFSCANPQAAVPGRALNGKRCRYVNGCSRDEPVALLKQRVRLAREADHHVRPNRRLRHRLADRRQLLRVVPGPIAPVHRAQDGVGTGLQRQMGMPRQPRPGRCRIYASVLPVERQQLHAPVHRLHGADAQPGQRRPLQNRRDQILQPRRSLKIASPAAQVDAGEHQLLPARLHEATDALAARPPVTPTGCRPASSG